MIAEEDVDFLPYIGWASSEEAYPDLCYSLGYYEVMCKVQGDSRVVVSPSTPAIVSVDLIGFRLLLLSTSMFLILFFKLKSVKNYSDMTYTYKHNLCHDNHS